MTKLHPSTTKGLKALLSNDAKFSTYIEDMTKVTGRDFEYNLDNRIRASILLNSFKNGAKVTVEHNGTKYSIKYLVDKGFCHGLNKMFYNAKITEDSEEFNLNNLGAGICSKLDSIKEDTVNRWTEAYNQFNK